MAAFEREEKSREEAERRNQLEVEKRIKECDGKKTRGEMERIIRAESFRKRNEENEKKNREERINFIEIEKNISEENDKGEKEDGHQTKVGQLRSDLERKARESICTNLALENERLGKIAEEKRKSVEIDRRTSNAGADKFREEMRERKAREESERKIKEEIERSIFLEIEKTIKLENERKVAVETVKKAAQERRRTLNMEHEKKVKEEHERKLILERERMLKYENDRRQRDDNAQRIKSEHERNIREELERKANIKRERRLKEEYERNNMIGNEKKAKISKNSMSSPSDRRSTTSLQSSLRESVGTPRKKEKVRQSSPSVVAIAYVSRMRGSTTYEQFSHHTSFHFMNLTIIYCTADLQFSTRMLILLTEPDS